MTRSGMVEGAPFVSRGASRAVRHLPVPGRI
jgi:hypothetical protein